MSTVTISNLPAAGALTGTELLPVVQSGTTSNTTVQDIANLAGSFPYTGSAQITGSLGITGSLVFRVGSTSTNVAIGNSALY
jgi:xanthine/uracil permease